MIISQELPKRYTQHNNKWQTSNKNKRYKSPKEYLVGPNEEELLSDHQVAPMEMFDQRKQTIASGGGNLDKTMELNEEDSAEVVEQAVSIRLKKKHIKKNNRNYGIALPSNPYSLSKSIDVGPAKFRQMSNYNYDGLSDPNSIKGTLQKIKDWKTIADINE